MDGGRIKIILLIFFQGNCYKMRKNHDLARLLLCAKISGAIYQYKKESAVHYMLPIIKHLLVNYLPHLGKAIVV